MSELKATTVYDAYWKANSVGEGTGVLVYLKSEADKVIAHHKYKRCLAMAYVEWLKQMVLCNYPESILYRRAFRRERKWKKLAEKFKEAK